MNTESGTNSNTVQNSTSNVIDLNAFRGKANQALLDDIGGRAFMFLRDQANENDLPVKSVLADHMLGIANVLKSVEGAEAANDILNQVKALIGGGQQQASAL